MITADFNQKLVHSSAFLKPFAIALTHDRDQAGDLFQETLYRALLYRDKYSPGTSLKAWLYTIMRNIFINNYRSKVRRKTVLDGAPGELVVSMKQPVVNNFAESNIGEKAIWKAVDELPGVFKTPFLMYLNGAKYQQIATSLKEPVGTVKSRIHFARKMLRQQLSRNEAYGLN